MTYRIFMLLGLTFCKLAPAQRLEFEVASVRPNNVAAQPFFGQPQRSGDFVTLKNVQLYTLVYYAYQLKGNYEMVGFPNLPDSERWFDIEAKAGASATDDQVRLMMQSLLEDRFKLKVHRETRELPAYELTAIRGGRLTPARTGDFTVTIEDRTIAARPDTCGTSLWREGNHIVCHAVGMDKIASQLGGLLQAPVLDRTGLTGSYDLNVLYIPKERTLAPDAPPGGILEDAVQDQLGLKLTKGKGPVPVLVIDHIEKPTEN